MISRRSFIGALSAACYGQAGRPQRFGLIADVQFADQDTNGRRAYRDSLKKLNDAARLLAAEQPVFTVHLGDLVDKDVANFHRVRTAFDRLPGKRYDVLGNHDFFAPRAEVLREFGLERGYYSFVVGAWRFIVLDGMDVSVKGGWPEDSPNYTAALQLLGELRRSKARNAHDWNGAVGEVQRAWLARELRVAERSRQRAVVFCHFPALAASCRPDHLLWDHAQVVQVLESSPAVAAYINGHDHNGGYAEQNGIHYVTLPGMVEHDAQSSVRVCDALTDRLVLRRPGDRDGQVLSLKQA